MNPQLLSSLAAEHRRDLDAAMTDRAGPSAPGRRHTHPVTIPRFRVSWTRMTLAAVAGNRRGRSVVIVISATRTS
jgi:hypothetical protein